MVVNQYVQVVEFFMGPVECKGKTSWFDREVPWYKFWTSKEREAVEK
jgi:hypothetical protein